MKKTTTAFLLICFATTTHAQFFKGQPTTPIKKGTTLLGGSLQLNNNSTKVQNVITNNNTLQFNPQISCGVGTNKVRGINLYISNSKNVNGNVVDKNSGIGFGVFSRHYKSFHSLLYGIIQSDISYHYYEYNRIGIVIPTNVSTNAVNINVQPGIAINISKNFQAEILFSNMIKFSYHNSVEKKPNISISPIRKNNLFLNGNLDPTKNISFGFRYLLQPKIKVG